MKSMVLSQICDINKCSEPLELADIPIPSPNDKEVLLKVSVCGVCHTELDEIEGRTVPSIFPIVPGHQVVGTIESIGSKVSALKVGERVGVGWVYSTCGKCNFCQQGDDNLCPEFKATGRDANGGYAEYMTVPASSVSPIPESFTDFEAAPLLCAGAIGYRSLFLSCLENGQNIGLTGFGASAHLVLKMVKYRYPNASVFVFARSDKERAFALELGAKWSGDTEDQPPEKLDCIIDTTPAWKPVVEALNNLQSGGRLVINAIRKEDFDKDCLLRLNYEKHLWMEKEIKSVANVSKRDIVEFLELAAAAEIKPAYEVYSLEEANKALVELKKRHVLGAKVLKIN